MKKDEKTGWAEGAMEAGPSVCMVLSLRSLPFYLVCSWGETLWSGEERMMWNLHRSMASACVCVREMQRERQSTSSLKYLGLWREYRNNGFKTKWYKVVLPLKLHSWERQRRRTKKEQAGQAWKQMSEETRDSKGEIERQRELQQWTEMDGWILW